MSIAWCGVRRLPGKLPQRSEVSPHTSGARDKRDNTDDRRRPGDIFEEIKQLTEYADTGMARLGPAEMHE